MLQFELLSGLKCEAGWTRCRLLDRWHNCAQPRDAPQGLAADACMIPHEGLPLGHVQLLEAAHLRHCPEELRLRFQSDDLRVHVVCGEVQLCEACWQAGEQVFENGEQLGGEVDGVEAEGVQSGSVGDDWRGLSPK